MANVQFTSDGIWHGITVWALVLVGGMLLGALGVSGLLGFAGNAVTALRGILPTGVEISPADLDTATNIAANTAGYFLLASVLGSGAAILGGWLGSRRMSRTEAMTTETMKERRIA